MHVKSACTIPSVGGLSLPKSSPLMLTRLGGGCSQPASTVTAAFPSQHQTSQHQGHALQRDVLQPACALAYPATVSSWSQTAPQYDTHLIESDLGWRTVPLQANYSRGRVLGHGSFGAVTSATHLASGTPCAIKTMPKIRGKLTKEKTLEKLQREVDLLQRLQEYPAVVQLDDLLEDEHNVYVITELCAGGDLQHFSDVYGPLSEKCLALIAREILGIIKACHNTNVIHGDIKPANFCLREEHTNPLCSSEAVLRRSPWLKAIDFGCSQLHFGTNQLSKRSGTPVYMAPEIFARSYSYEVDMWSLGVMLYQLFTRRFPFWEGDAYSKALSLDEVAKAVTEAPICYDYGPWLSMSAEGLDFIQGCLTRDPDERMTEDEALEHPWLSKLISDANEGYGAQSNNISPFQQVKGDTSVAA